MDKTNVTQINAEQQAGGNTCQKPEATDCHEPKAGAYQEARIIENTQIYDKVFKMVVAFDGDGQNPAGLASPGQFCMLRNWDLSPILSRPISICDTDGDTMTFLYLVVGKGTKLLSQQKPQDKISVLGPLGKGFDMKSSEKAALISGGIGIAPLLMLAKHLFSQGTEVDLYCGFRDHAYFTEVFQPYCASVKIASENGLEGRKGNVLTIFEQKDYAMVYACGPNKMLQALKEHIHHADNTTMQLSLEAHMACGIGACLGCTVKTTDKMARVCMEGPVFDAKEVVFDA